MGKRSGGNKNSSQITKVILTPNIDELNQTSERRHVSINDESVD